MPQVTFEYALQQTVKRNIDGATGAAYTVVAQRYDNSGGGEAIYYDIEKSGDPMVLLEVAESEIFDPSAQ